MAEEHPYRLFGDWLKRMRKARGLKQERMAGDLSYSLEMYRKVESGARRPNQEFLQALPGYLKIEAGEVPPLDGGIPAPGKLPPGSRVPYQPNPHFVGRQPELFQLARALRQTRCALITGLGGVGKTQLAVEFAYRYGAVFSGGVFWIGMADAEAIAAQVAACGGAHGLRLQPGFDDLPLNRQIDLVQRAWEEPVARLLIFDNCREEASLRQWLPRSGGARVLATSRRQLKAQPVCELQLRLDVVEAADGEALLLDLCPTLNTGVATELAHQLGNLPLALHLAGSFLQRYGHTYTPTRYLQRLQAGEEVSALDHPSLVGRGAEPLPTDHDRHVGRTLAVSFEQLDPADEVDRTARQLLVRAAHLAPNRPIPRHLLLSTLHWPLDADEEVSLLAEDGLHRLLEMALTEEGTAGTVRLHRLVAAFARRQADPAARVDVETAVITTAQAANAARSVAPVQEWQEHLRYVTDSAEANANGAALAQALGQHLHLASDYPQAHRYLTRAVELYDMLYGPDNLPASASLTTLGVTLNHTGDPAGALAASKRAVAIRQRVLGLQHMATAESQTILGLSFEYFGRYSEACEQLETALRTRRQLLGDDHPDTAYTHHCLALVYKDMALFGEATAHAEQALAIARQALGSGHPDTARYLNNLGLIAAAQKDHAAAANYFRQAYDLRRDALGGEHSDTITAANNLGTALHCTGRLADAHVYLSQAAAHWERFYGPDHVESALGYCNLGRLLVDMGAYPEAERLLQQALRNWSAVLGEDYSRNGDALVGLGRLYQAQGDGPRGRDYLERALAIYRRRLGVDHPKAHDLAAELREGQVE